MPSDPKRPDQIATATLAWMREHVDGASKASWDAPLESADGGMTTFIWFGRLVGGALTAGFRNPLALRVFGTVEEDITREREGSILEFVAARSFPAPVPLATVPVSSGNPVGLPWMILPRIPGQPLLTVIGKAPWFARSRLRELALQVRLHSLPIAGCPLAADGSLVDRWLALRGPEIAEIATPRARAVLDTLERRADVVRAEDAVVCHGDFHPLNVLSERTASGWSHVVIDWTDAVVGDRHFDVARTLALFRVAWIVAGSRAEQVALRAIGPWLDRSYRRAYERSGPLDDDRLAYWSAAHLLRGWWQVTQLHADAFESTRADVEAVPESVADALLARAEHEISTLTPT